MTGATVSSDYSLAAAILVAASKIVSCDLRFPHTKIVYTLLTERFRCPDISGTERLAPAVDIEGFICASLVMEHLHQ